jgi:hypothetical protein
MGQGAPAHKPSGQGKQARTQPSPVDRRGLSFTARPLQPGSRSDPEAGTEPRHYDDVDSSMASMAALTIWSESIPVAL